ncbi:MAG: CoA-binding protein [Acidimicrobiales bacterium]|nr:MAG: CoA-binding protein [Acidimicrobiales bacterium]
MADKYPPVDGWEPPGALERKRMLDQAESIAIVGASSNPARASNFVATYLMSSSADYRVYLVNPRETEILGEPAYPDLTSLPEVPDLVDVFRRSEDLPAVADHAIAAGAKIFWAQLGLFNAEAVAKAAAAGMDVVMDRCTKIEHARFAGGLHLAGFDTGVISSKRRH